MAENDTTRVVRVFDRFADRYDRSIALFERFVAPGARSWAVSQAHGRVLELAVGTGLNLALYGARVDHVTGVDVSTRMLDLARARVADAAAGHVDVRHGDVQQLDLAGSSFDSVLSTFTLCTIPDPDAAMREAHRLLRPGGRLILAEHGPARNPAARAVMRLLDPLAVRLSADHLLRDPIPYVERAGFVVEEDRRSGLAGTVFRVLAHRPSSEASPGSADSSAR